MTFEAMAGAVVGGLVMIAALVVAVVGNMRKRDEIDRLKRQALQDAADRSAESEIDNEARANLDRIDSLHSVPDRALRLARAIEESRRTRERARRSLEDQYGCTIGSDCEGRHGVDRGDKDR